MAVVGRRIAIFYGGFFPRPDHARNAFSTNVGRTDKGNDGGGLCPFCVRASGRRAYFPDFVSPNIKISTENRLSCGPIFLFACITRVWCVLFYCFFSVTLYFSNIRFLFLSFIVLVAILGSFYNCPCDIDDYPVRYYHL